MTYNKNVKKYIKQCKYLFASYGKSEKEYTLVILMVFLCYKAYIYQKTFEEIRDSKGGYFEETIEIK